MIKIKAIFGLLFFLTTTFSFSDTLIADWKRIVAEQSQNSLSLDSQAFCYVDDQGEIQGHNIYKKMGQASVSKILTSFWALNTYGEDYQFKTKIYYQNKKIFIEGSEDPIFTRRSIYKLINFLNELGIKSVETLEYDKKFYFTPQGIDNSTHASVFTRGNRNYCKQYQPTANEFKGLLQKYLNTKLWNSNYIQKSISSIDSTGTQCINANIMTIKNDYAQKRKVFKDFTKKPNLEVKEIAFKEINPFLDSNGSVKKGVKVIEFKSTSMQSIIKYLNSVSANLPADVLFHNLGGHEAFRRKFAAIFLEIDDTKFSQFISGSGIPFKYYENGRWTRIPNYVDCHTILGALEIFHKTSNGNNFPFFTSFEEPAKAYDEAIAKKFLAVGGKDGTVASRFSGNYSKSIIAKTGTLGDASALAGTVNTNQGKRHFAIINNFALGSSQMSQISRNIQNLTVSELFKQSGGNRQFSYSPTESYSSTYFKTFDSNIKVTDY